MRKALNISRKELKVYFESPIAYIFITAFLVVSTWLFFRTFFLMNEATMRGFFVIVPWITLFFVPAITMRLWAEERKAGTNELLFSLPVEEWQVVLGKYLAALAVYAITIALTLPLAVTVGLLGQPEWGVVFANYLGTLLLSSAVLSIGTFVSSMTKNQIVAFIIGVIIVAGLMIAGEPIVTLFLPTAFYPLAEYLSLSNHFSGLARGVIDTRDVIYYALVVFLCQYLTVKVVRGTKVK